MAMKHDEDGFLVGTPVAMTTEQFDKSTRVMRQIKLELKKIREQLAGGALGGGGNSGGAGNTSPSSRKPLPDANRVRKTPTVMRERGPNGRFLPGPGMAPAPIVEPVPTATPPVPEENKNNPKDRPPKPGRKRKNGKKPPKDADRFGLKQFGNQAEKLAPVDPHIQAGIEAAGIAKAVTSPLRGLYRMMFLKGDKEDSKKTLPWFRKIWKELRSMNDRDKPGGAGGGGGGGFSLGSLFSGGGAMSWIKNLLGFGSKGGKAGMFSRLGSWLGKSRLGSAIGRNAGRFGRFAGKFGKGALRKLPGIGNLITAGMGLYDVFGPEDKGMNAEQNRERKFKGGGSATGALVGGALGTLLDPFIGPFGTILGGMIGSVVGEKIGGALSKINWERLGSSIKQVFTDAADGVKKTYNKVVNKTTDAIQTTVEASSAMWNRAKRLIGVRGKVDFSGFSGAEGMSRLGTYTNDEASMITGLKKSGANTSANIKGGMSASIRDKITKASVAAGIDPKLMLEMAAMESGGNPNAISATGAIGLYQFTGKTASDVGVGNRFNADANIAGAISLAMRNTMALRRAGLPVTAANAYMLHQLGEGAGIELIKGAMNGKKVTDLSPSTQTAISRNFGAKMTTAADYLKANGSALDSRYNSVVVGGGGIGTGGGTAAPNMDTMKPPQAPVTRAPAGSKPDSPKVGTGMAPPGQNIGDRAIAHISTGGMANYMG